MNNSSCRGKRFVVLATDETRLSGMPLNNLLRHANRKV